MMTTTLAIASVCFLGLGAVGSLASGPTDGLGAIGIAGVLAVLARIAQASSHPARNCQPTSFVKNIVEP